MTVYQKTAATGHTLPGVGSWCCGVQEDSRRLDGSAAASADRAGQTPGTAGATDRADRGADPARADGRRDIRRRSLSIS